MFRRLRKKKKARTFPRGRPGPGPGRACAPMHFRARAGLPELISATHFLQPILSTTPQTRASPPAAKSERVPVSSVRTFILFTVLCLDLLLLESPELIFLGNNLFATNTQHRTQNTIRLKASPGVGDIFAASVAQYCVPRTVIKYSTSTSTVVVCNLYYILGLLNTHTHRKHPHAPN